jgi:transcriptional regulator GlxA family with amidase domain
MTSAPSPLEIAIVVRERTLLGIVHGLTDLFRITDELSRVHLGSDQPVLRLSHFADTGAGGIVRTFDSLAGADQPDAQSCARVVIIPPRETAILGIESGPKWSDWLIAQHAGGAILASICGGTFLLAQTGLLDGRRATAHSCTTEDLTTLFPAVGVDMDAVRTEDDDIITVGGIMAWTDLALVIVRRLLGNAAMMATADFMMLEPPNREQRFHKTFAPEMNHGDSAILKSQYELHARPPVGVTVNDMAHWSGLELRTFTRRFHGATGLRPNEYRLKLRMEKARELLEANTVPISQVAFDVGYGDIASFRQVFAREMGLRPSDYRKRFGHIPVAP